MTARRASDGPRAVAISPPPGAWGCRGDGERVASLVTDLGYRPADPGEDGACVAALVREVPARGAPGGDGLHACAALAPVMPVMVLSDRPSGDFAWRLAASRAGASAVLPLPLDPVALASWLGDVDRAARPRSRILVVDDDAFVAEHCALTLEAAGFETHVECDPARVLLAIAAVRPDLLLLDMQMPGASGMEVASIIRQDRAATALPIVFLSAERDPERRLGARRVGGDDFIDKGVDPATLVEIVSMRTARARALSDMASRDGLTGLVGHAGFKERLDEIAGDRAPCTVGMIDIDRFKAINDGHGHPAGDEVLRALARTLRGGLRATDTVARYGGEEFGVLIDASPHDACRALDRLRRRFAARTIDTGGGHVRATFSAGLAALGPTGPGASFDPSHDRARAALLAADGALYRAKREGRDRIILAGENRCSI